jgi:hypothetical protein
MARFLRTPLASFVCLGCLLSACGNKGPGEPVETLQTHELPAGPLEALYTEIESQAAERSFLIDECDTANAETKLRIARFIDINLGGVTQAMGDLSDAPATPTPGAARTIGPVKVRARVAIESGAPTWRRDSSDTWSELDTYRERVEAFIAAKDFASAKSYLQYLDYNLRAKVPDEKRRRIFGANYELRDDNLADFQSLKRSVDTCVGDPKCLPIDLQKRLSAGPLRILNETKLYKALSKWVLEAEDTVQSRKRLETLKLWVDNDVNFVSPRRTVAVKRLSAGNFEVALHAGALAGIESQVADFIAEIWSPLGRQIRVRWAENLESVDSLVPFQFDLVKSQGRGYVSYSEKKIVLPQVIQYATLHHELGHVLGLPDGYYTTFDSKTCTYTQHSRAKDLMSSSSSGGVLDEHWSALEALY